MFLTISETYTMNEMQTMWDECLSTLRKLSETNDGNLCCEYLPKITCPTLIIHGERDGMVPITQAEYLHKNIKGSVLRKMPQGKHNIHRKYADEFNNIVTDFCNDNAFTQINVIQQNKC